MKVIDKHQKGASPHNSIEHIKECPASQVEEVAVPTKGQTLRTGRRRGPLQLQLWAPKTQGPRLPQ
eukprot:11543258-Alexandrium_andersonii.AAC.1